jgi:hypothetical protein
MRSRRRLRDDSRGAAAAARKAQRTTLTPSNTVPVLNLSTASATRRGLRALLGNGVSCVGLGPTISAPWWLPTSTTPLPEQPTAGEVASELPADGEQQQQQPQQQQLVPPQLDEFLWEEMDLAPDDEDDACYDERDEGGTSHGGTDDDVHRSNLQSCGRQCGARGKDADLSNEQPDENHARQDVVVDLFSEHGTAVSG